MASLFLEIARSPQVSPEGAKTVRRLKEFASCWDEGPRNLSDEDAYKTLKQKEWISLQASNGSDEKITDLSPLAEFRDLAGLALNGNKIVCLEPLADLTNLRRLALHENHVVDLSPLATLPNLVDLEIHDNPVHDLSPLAHLPSLRILEISSTQLIEGLARHGAGKVVLPQLWSLTIRGHLEDLRCLPDCPALRQLQICRCDSFDGIEKFTDLRNLCSGGGNASDLTPLRGLKKLTHLTLDHHAIVDLEPLSRLYALRDVSLSSNRITSVEALSRLPVLHSIDLADNPVPADEVSALETSLEPWDVEFAHKGPPRPHRAPIKIVDQETWDYYDQHPFGLDQDDGDCDLLWNEKCWLAGRIDAALSTEWESEEDFVTPGQSPYARSFTVCLYHPEMIQQTRWVVDVIQQELAAARNDFIIYLHTDCAEDDAPWYTIWVYRDKILVTPDQEEVVRALMA